MAGHSQFKNIMHKKNAQDQKRAKLFTKLSREIYVAAKNGSPEPEMNPRLRTAITNARVANLPKDRIEAAIKKASTTAGGDNFEEVRYEGYGPGGIAVIVEALTDNRNRTASDVRSAFTKAGGNLGETGSVNFMFHHKGVIIYPANIATEEEMLEHAINAGAENCELMEDHYEITCDPKDLHIVSENLSKILKDSEYSGVTWLPENKNAINEEQKISLDKLIDLLEESDDVQNVYHNAEI